MATTQLPAVFLLVRSLSKSEKRYFRLFSGLQDGDKIFTALFDLIERDTPVPADIRRKLEAMHPGAVFDVACKHLYRMIMRSLRMFEEGKSIENKLVTLIQEVRILFNKGLLSNCFSELERGKKLASQYEKHLLHAQLCRMELQFLQTLEFTSLDESQLIQLQDRINDLLYQELYINKHASLFEILSHRYLHRGISKNERDRANLNDLLLEEFQINSNALYNSFESDRLHRHFQSTYFMMTGAPEQGLQELLELLRLFEANASHRDDDPVYYIYLLQGIITSLRWMDKISEMRSFITKLQQLAISAHSQRVMVEHFVFQDELGILLSQGKYDEGVGFISANPLSLPAPPNIVAVSYLNISLTYFGTGDFRAALRNINEAMQPGALYISSQVLSLCHLVSMIIHLELSNDDLLVSTVRSMERKLRTRGESYRIERLAVSFVRKWVRSSLSKRSKLLEQFAIELRILREDQYENQFMKWFNIDAWAHSKLRRLSGRTKLK